MTRAEDFVRMSCAFCASLWLLTRFGNRAHNRDYISRLRRMRQADSCGSSSLQQLRLRVT